MGKSVLSSLLPSGVCLEESWDDKPTDLFEAEALLVAGAIPARQQEFATGRACARRALARLGVESGPIGRDAAGAPTWPVDVVGSITHCQGYRAAAVARKRLVRGIGIDAEPLDSFIDEQTGRLVLRPEELRRAEQLMSIDPNVPWKLLHFSAKEAIYKFWHPQNGSWLGFDDVALHFDLAHSSFRVSTEDAIDPDIRARLGTFDGRFAVSSTHVFTLVT